MGHFLVLSVVVLVGLGIIVHGTPSPVELVNADEPTEGYGNSVITMAATAVPTLTPSLQAPPPSVAPSRTAAPATAAASPTPTRPAQAQAVAATPAPLHEGSRPPLAAGLPVTATATISATRTATPALTAGPSTTATPSPLLAQAVTPSPRPLDLGDLGPAGSLAASSGSRGTATPPAAARATATPTATSTPARPADPSEIVRYHEVRPGDTLDSIARRYGISAQSILSINPIISDRDVLKVGLQLYVPTREGVVVFVRRGETVSELAERYKVKAEDIVGFRANGLDSADAIREGELVLIPNGVRPAPPPPPPAPTPQPTPARTATPQPTPQPTVLRTATPAPAAPAAAQPAAPARAPEPVRTATPVPVPVRTATPAPPAPAVSSGGWVWPYRGTITSYFSPGHPLGIDIAPGNGMGGGAIVAAKGGTVTFAGGNPCCSYGYYVEIDHGGGWSTLYGHCMSPPPVRIGQAVGAGQTVCLAGTTGYSTGVHLHFEIRRNSTPVNPLAYLP